MCLGQPSGCLHGDAQDLDQLERTALVQPILKRLAIDIFHDQVGEAVGLVDGVDVDDVLVADRGGSLSFTCESSPSRRGRRKLRRHDLDRDDPLQDFVERLEHHPHAPLADDGEHVVVIQTAQHSRFFGRAEEIQVDLPARSERGLSVRWAAPVLDPRLERRILQENRVFVGLQ